MFTYLKKITLIIFTTALMVVLEGISKHSPPALFVYHYFLLVYDAEFFKIHIYLILKLLILDKFDSVLTGLLVVGFEPFLELR